MSAGRRRQTCARGALAAHFWVLLGTATVAAESRPTGEAAGWTFAGLEAGAHRATAAARPELNLATRVVTFGAAARPSEIGISRLGRFVGAAGGHADSWNGQVRFDTAVGPWWQWGGGHGPLARLAIGAEAARLGGVRRTAVDLPGVQLGYGVFAGPIALDIIAETGLTLAGKSWIADETSNHNLTLPYGAALSLMVGSIGLDARVRRVADRNAELASGGLCGLLDSFTLCSRVAYDGVGGAEQFRWLWTVGLGGGARQTFDW